MGSTLVRGYSIAAAALCAAVMLATASVAQDKPANPAGAWSAKVTPDGTQTAALDEKQTALMKRINTYFNELNVMKGSFVQTGADKKRMKGKFYVKRPGRFRFDYSLPSRQIIVSDGQYLAIQDLDLQNEDRVALDQTPFRLLLRKDVDLLRDAKILELQEAEDLAMVTIQDKDPDAPGRIKLFLATKPAMELKEWVTLDAQGLETRVEVADIVRTDDVDAALFKIQPVGLDKGMR
jgi:outer membrane lipoprotein-sorting protein